MFLSIQYPVLFSIHTLNTLCSSVFSTLSCFLFILLTLYVPQYSVPCLVFYSYSWHFMFLSIQYPVLFSIHTLDTLCSSVFSTLSCFLFILLILYVPQYSVPCLVFYSLTLYVPQYSVPCLVFYSYSEHFMFPSIQYPVLFSIHTLDTLCSSVFSTVSCFLFILLTLYVPQYSVPCLVFYSYSWYFMFLRIQYPVLFSIHTPDTLCSLVFSILSCFLFIFLTLYVPQYSVLSCFLFILLILYVPQYSVSCLVFYSYSWYFMFLSIQYPVLFSIHTLDTLCSSVFSTLVLFYIHTTLACFLFILSTLYVPQYSVPCLVFYSYSWYCMFLSIQYPVLFSIHTLNTLCSSVFSTLSCFLFILLALYVPQYSVPCLVFYSYSWYFMFLSIQYPVLFCIHTLNTLCSSVFSTLSCFLFILLILYVPQYSVPCLVFYSYSWHFMFLSIQYPVLFWHFIQYSLNTLCSSVFSTLSCFLFILLTLYVPQYSVPCLVFYSYSWYFMFLSIQYPVLFSIHTLNTLCSSVFSTLSCFLFIHFMFLSIQYPVLFSIHTLDTLCSSVFSTLSCFIFILLTLYVP